MKSLIPQELIEKRIFLIRSRKVMLSIHLAELYNVETRALIQAVQRNRERFPADFMFQLNKEEYNVLKSQIVISSWGGARRARPYAFTETQRVQRRQGAEQGVAMLSSVLHSKKAIQVNIAIMRAFVKLRKILSTHKELAYKLSELERKFEKHDIEIQGIFEAIRQLMRPVDPSRRKIGF